MTSLVKTKPVKIRIGKPILTWLALLWLLTVDFLTRISAGPLSVSGALTLAGSVLCLALAPVIVVARTRGGGSQGERGVPIVLSLFVAYALVRLAITPSSEGLQNVAVYTTFVLAIGLTIGQITNAAALIVARRMRYIAVFVSLVFLGSFLAGVEIYGERAYAVAGLIFMAVLIPYQPKNKLYRVAPFMVAGVIALSLSRTATIIALVMLVFLSVRGKRGFRLVKSAALASMATGLAYWLITYYAPFRDRFIGGDNAASFGNIELNTSGRSVLWELTLNSAQENPIFGKGPGAASALISASFRNIGHPHNDYLRLFHDFGFVGAALFVLGLLTLLLRTARRARYSSNAIHWSATLGILAVLAAALTDNVIVYPFVMVPLGFIVGASLGLPVETKAYTVAPGPDLLAPYERTLDGDGLRGRTLV